MAPLTASRCVEIAFEPGVGHVEVHMHPQAVGAHALVELLGERLFRNRVARRRVPSMRKPFRARLVRGRRIRALRVRVPTLADVRNRGRTDRRGRAAPARSRGSGRFLAQLREAVGRACEDVRADRDHAEHRRRDDQAAAHGDGNGNGLRRLLRGGLPRSRIRVGAAILPGNRGRAEDPGRHRRLAAWSSGGRWGREGSGGRRGVGGGRRAAKRRLAAWSSGGRWGELPVGHDTLLCFAMRLLRVASLFVRVSDSSPCRNGRRLESGDGRQGRSRRSENKITAMRR